MRKETGLYTACKWLQVSPIIVTIRFKIVPVDKISQRKATGTDMETQSRTSGLVVKGGQRKAGIGVNETFWGYVIRPGHAAIRRAAWGERIASFAAVLLGMGAYGQWLLPGSINDPEVLPFKIAGTVIFGVVSGMLYLIARRGLCGEIQVDVQRRAIRTARRNRHGSATQIDEIGFEFISSAFIARSKSPWVQDRLSIRLRGSQHLIAVAAADESELAPVLERLSGDLRAAAAAKKPEKTPKPVRSAFAAK